MASRLPNNAIFSAEAPNRGTKRRAISIKDKQLALRLLGAQNDGTFTTPQYNHKKKKLWVHSDVAKQIGVSTGTLTGWKHNCAAIMRLQCNSKNGASVSRVRDAQFPELEKAVYQYVYDTMSYMKGESAFRSDIIRSKALKVKGTMLEKLTSLITNETDAESAKKMVEQKGRLEKFTASHGWANKFLKRNGMCSKKGNGSAGHFPEDQVRQARTAVKKSLATRSIHDLCNSDEVAVLYRSLPSRTVRFSNGPTAYERVRERFTVVLTIGADGTKFFLTVIGKAKKPKSFPRHFDAMRDLGIYYQSQDNAWNTKVLWTRTVQQFNQTASLQGRTLASVLDNCSAHSIDYETFDNLDAVFLPPNLTCHLQPVDASVGRSFKCIYRRLLIEHILKYVDDMFKISFEWRPPFDIRKAVTSYDAVCLLSKAWNLVPKSVVLKSWLSTGILTPAQTRDVRNILGSSKGIIDPAVKPQKGSYSALEKSVVGQRAITAKKVGEEWLSSGIFEEDMPAMQVEDENLWSSMKDDLKDLNDSGAIECFDEADWDNFIQMEGMLDVCQPVTPDNAVSVAVCEALGVPTEEALRSDCVEHESDDETHAVTPVKPSVSKYQKLVHELHDELASFIAHEHEFASSNDEPQVERLLGASQVEIDRVAKFRKQRARQARIDDFFKP